MKHNSASLISSSLESQVYGKILDEILSKKIKVGERISEDALASRYGVSRTPVREAIKRLGEAGLLEIHPRSSVKVTSFDEKRVLEIKELAFSLEKFALSRIGEGEFDESEKNLEEILTKSRKALEDSDSLLFLKYDSLFFMELVALSSGIDLRDVYSGISLKLLLIKANRDFCSDDLDRVLRIDNSLLKLIKDNDIESALLKLEEHMDILIK